MTFPTLPPVIAEQALDLADELRARADAVPPPVIAGLSPRRRAAYDRLVDAVNRLPRPLMVLGSLVLLGSALVAPDWFAARMDALSDMPDALWWIIGAVLSLHFGARYQDRSQDFRREMATTAPTTRADVPRDSEADLLPDALGSGPNAALDAWRNAKA
ncbi:Methionine synthase I, cobalamin-binding protein domain protein [Rubellimicrobium mesophilum DSM 19309]|uniref:Methionine synthase I, cobalamin-binding protein domain protein n=1 Tax=Rubellimicrobium mesophilum DSM 19309 TaxID=442562 RepID=A0A017HP20_9RHOB|nr:3TM-type holin [Rubellimicrobium mesophilum]EYD76257.1 Methionine synthase I, cobalamin-binding protein domain protein [Rubellimicrobium mesophilum DSM 19309]